MLREVLDALTVRSWTADPDNFAEAIVEFGEVSVLDSVVMSLVNEGVSYVDIQRFLQAVRAYADEDVTALGIWKRAVQMQTMTLEELAGSVDEDVVDAVEGYVHPDLQLPDGVELNMNMDLRIDPNLYTGDVRISELEAALARTISDHFRS